MIKIEKIDSIPSKWRYIGFLVCFIAWIITGVVTIPSACSAPVAPVSTPGCDNKDTSACSYCTNETSQFQSSGSVIGSYMINQMFLIINQILSKVQTTFYTGIIGSTSFQQALGVAFLLYICIYGLMIMLNLASYRTGEVTSRLVRIAIIYSLTTTGGWTFFSTWIEQPVIGEMNQLITTMANTASGSGGRCSSQGQFSGAGPASTSGSASGSTFTVSLSTGPMAMLFGPMSCVFASQFIASVMALVSSSSYGWLLALAVLWGLVEFSKMVLGAIITYVKAIIGLAILFGIAPIFIAFYLFEKTRPMTMAWVSMVFGFALQPVMLFAFLAFYATIIGGSLTNMLSDASGNPLDICYVPFYEMPRLFDVYWERFKNSGHAAGGEIFNASGASGADQQLPVQVLNVLYFVVLCNLGKNFCNYINELSTSISAGSSAGTSSGDNIGNFFKRNLTDGKGIKGTIDNLGQKFSSGKQDGSSTLSTRRTSGPK